MAFHEIESAAHTLFENIVTGYQVIARSHYHRCFGIERGYMIGCPRYAGSRVAPVRLQKNPLLRNFRQLFPDHIHITAIGYNKNIFRTHDGQYPVIAHLQQRTAGSEKIQKLFRLVGTAVGPETATDSSAHYDAISVGIRRC